MTRSRGALQDINARRTTDDAREHGRDRAKGRGRAVTSSAAVLAERLADRSEEYRRGAENYSTILRTLDEAVAERSTRSALPAISRAREDEARAAYADRTATGMAPPGRSLTL
jgi:hypothetical protein